MRGKEYIISPYMAGDKAIIEHIREIAALEGVESLAVSPIYVDLAAIAIGASKPEIVATLSRGTYPEVSALECAMAMENGADEIEVSLPLELLASGDKERVEAEIGAIIDEVADEAKISISFDGSTDDEQLVKEAVLLAISLEVDSIKICCEDSEQAQRASLVAVVSLAESSSSIALKSNSFSSNTIGIAERNDITLIDIIYKN